MPKTSFFITGTDTDSGKTAVSGGMLALAAQQGLRTLAMKPIASGCHETPDGLRNPDALHLQAAITEPLSYEAINPIALAPAIAPHVAAADAGRSVSANRLAGYCRGTMTRPAEFFLVEGAGGWRVPLNDTETWTHFVRDLNMPVVLVVGMKLGAINHALLSAEMIRRDGLELAGWVANRCTETPMEREDETFDYLCEHLEAPCMGRVPRLEADSSGFPAPETVARYLSLPLGESG